MHVLVGGHQVVGLRAVRRQDVLQARDLHRAEALEELLGPRLRDGVTITGPESTASSSVHVPEPLGRSTPCA